MKKKNILQSLIFILFGINLMLGALIVGAKLIPIEQSIPSATTGLTKPQLRIEYGMEPIGEERIAASQEEGNGYWKVEHYQEYEYHYDHDGKLIEKRPTNYREHIRYWQELN